MGRLKQALRQGRADPRTSDRVVVALRAPARAAKMRDVIVLARDAGRSCYFRPLFDRPRQWAAQRNQPSGSTVGSNASNE